MAWRVGNKIWEQRGRFLSGSDPQTAPGAAVLSTPVPAMRQGLHGHIFSLLGAQAGGGKGLPSLPETLLNLKPPHQSFLGSWQDHRGVSHGTRGCYGEGRLESNQTLPPMKMKFGNFDIGDVIQGGKGPFWP